MPAVDLTIRLPKPKERQVTTTPLTAADHVLAVLAGTPLLRAASDAGMDPTDLAEAVGVYRAAGQAAVQAHVDQRWHETRVQFTDVRTAEAVVTDHLLPALHEAQAAGVITAWWYIRKAPCWRIRYCQGPTISTTRLTARITTLMNGLVHQGLAKQWRPAIYEPELCAFGGPTGMTIAHRLFHADTIGTLEHLRRHTTNTATLGRREMALLLCTALFRGARQEWHEQGDIWHRVTDMRPLAAGTTAEQLHDLTRSLRRVLAVDLDTTSALCGPGGQLEDSAPWITTFTAAGRDLAAAVNDATLHRGVRDILAHHVIFHFNRLGVPDRHQAILAHAAHDAVMQPSAQAHR